MELVSVVVDSSSKVVSGVLEKGNLRHVSIIEAADYFLAIRYPEKVTLLASFLGSTEIAS